MIKKLVAACSFFLMGIATSFAQEEVDEGPFFKKENLFTGGSLSIGFGNRSFVGGVNPQLGYSFSNWLDAGVVVNYTFASERRIYYTDDKITQSIFGGGAFIKIYPVKFLFLQAQQEHNFITQKYKMSGSTIEKLNISAGSTLLGGGYTTGREGRGGAPFFYMSVLFDVSGNKESPYTDQNGASRITVRGGMQIPLFQGRNRF